MSARCVGLPLLVAAVCVLGAARARAQDGPADTTIVPIEGVTVTGSRSPEPLLRTPAAVTLVPRDRLVPRRQINLADGLVGVPGVFSQPRGGAQDVRITIRGYGARGNGERSNAGNMRGIRVLTDGIPLTEPDGRTSLELIDLGGTERIEVLRSNGSALYGNASGGVVNLRSSIDSGVRRNEWSARGGSFGFHREQGVWGFDAGGARGQVSAYTSMFDGWRRHSESATTSVQSRLVTPLAEDTRLGVLLDFISSLNRYPGALTDSLLGVDRRMANPTFVTRDERRFNRVGRMGLTVDRDRPGSQRLAVATWVEPKVLQRSERGRFRDFTRYHTGGSATWQLETPLGTDWRGVWAVGADEQYQDGAIQFYDLGPGGTRGTSLIQNKREAANSAGAFLQGELRWGNAWSFRLAGRYDNLWYVSEDRIDPSLNAAKHFTHVTPKGSIARYLGDHTVYASVGGGVEAPAFNEIDPPPDIPPTSLNPFLEPMRSTSYEVGAKGRLAAGTSALGRLGYDVALYWIDVTNEIVPFNGGAYFFTAGKARRRGAELGLDWAPVDGFAMHASVTASENEYRRYVNSISGVTNDFSGNEIAGLPSVFFDAGARWNVIGGLSVAGNVKHVGRYFADDANLAPVGAFELLGAQVEYAYPAPFGTLRAFVLGDNLADRDHVASVFINGINGEFFEPGLPRNFSAGVSLALH